MRLLLDQGLPRGAVDLRTALGHNVVHTSAVRLSEAEDTDILQWARTRRRIEGLKASPLASLLEGVLMRCRRDLLAGAMVTVTNAGIHVHRLPILRQR